MKNLSLFSALALGSLAFSGCATDSASPAAAAPVQAPETKAHPPGGFSPVSTTDAGALAAAKAAAAKFGDGWKFQKLVAAQSQVVAGTNYELILSLAKGGENALATATVWKKLDGTFEVTAHRWSEKSGKGKEPVAGGFTKLDPADAGAQAAAQAVVAKIGDGWTLAKLVTAQSQVVAGTNYKLTLNLAKGGEKKKAAATVWKKLDGTLEVTDWKWQKQDDKPTKEVVPGGFSKVDTSNVDAIIAAKAAADKIGNGWTYDGLLSAQSQVVAGTNFKLVLRLAKNSEKQKATATVWKKLDGTLEVTDWKWQKKDGAEKK